MLSEIRDETKSLINRACEKSDPVLVEAPPSSGKTYNAIQQAEKTGQKVLYLAGRTDLYEQACAQADKEGVKFETIPSPFRDCATFKGENDGQEKKARRMYNRGKSGRAIHTPGGLDIHTPCGNDGKCDYIQKLNNVQFHPEKFELLIGNHQHAYSEAYVEDRIVIIDEFDIDSFLTKFPSPNPQLSDAPEEVVPPFLEAAEGFPCEDFTDLVEARVARGDVRERALTWFEEEIEESIDKLASISSAKYKRTHEKSPFLAYSILCMEDLGNGVEVAHEPERWETLGVNPSVRCVRDRNLGEMMILEPPPLNLAEQVIGLNAFPVKPLWDLVYGCEFTHERVIPRDELGRYIEDGLNMEIRQVGKGSNHYSTGNITRKDQHRFAVIRALEDRCYPVITRKKALESYKNEDWFENCVEHDDEDQELKVKQYAKVLSSNDYEAESLGLVSGSPYPGDNVVKRWAGLHKVATEANRSGEGPRTGQSLTGFNDTGDDFEDLGDAIYQHLTHNKVTQAILRFGRKDTKSETTVYVNTTALPDWLPVTSLHISDLWNSKKRTHVLEALISSTVLQNPPKGMTTREIRQEAIERLDDEEKTITRERVRQIVREEVSEYVRVEANAGDNGADIFFWESEEKIKPLPVESNVADRFIKAGSKIHLVRPRQRIDYS